VEDVSLLLAELPVVLDAAGKIDVPSTLVSGRIAEQKNVSAYYGGNVGYTIRDGHLSYAFQIPPARGGAQARELRVDVFHSYGYGGAPVPGGVIPAVTYSAFDWQRNAWVEVPDLTANPQLPTPERFMSADGRVMVRIGSAGGETNIESLNLTAQVEML
jgi:hypothetical protein